MCVRVHAHVARRSFIHAHAQRQAHKRCLCACVFVVFIPLTLPRLASPRHVCVCLIKSAHMFWDACASWSQWNRRMRIISTLCEPRLRRARSDCVGLLLRSVKFLRPQRTTMRSEGRRSGFFLRPGAASFTPKNRSKGLLDRSAHTHCAHTTIM